MAKIRPPEELRRKGFRIGEVHGKLLPGGDPREYGIQRAMYLIGTVRLRYVKGRHTDVRLIGYEIPLCKARRGESVDLVGYDSRFNVYLFELKRADNPEPLSQVVKQVNVYSAMFEQIKPDFEREFRQAFFIQNPLQGVVKCICAPRKYYTKDGAANLKFAQSYLCDVRLGYLGGIHDETEAELLEQHAGGKPVAVNFYNPPRVKRQWA